MDNISAAGTVGSNKGLPTTAAVAAVAVVAYQV